MALVLAGDVRRLLETTRSAADRSPNRLLGSWRTAVSTVYVQQRVEQPRAVPARPDGRTDGGPYRLLITTSPLAGHATSMLGGGSVGHYTLLPFDRRSLGEFARRWFEPEGDLVADFLAQVTAGGPHDVASVPLMATIAYADGGERWIAGQEIEERATGKSK